VKKHGEGEKVNLTVDIKAKSFICLKRKALIKSVSESFLLPLPCERKHRSMYHFALVTHSTARDIRGAAERFFAMTIRSVSSLKANKYFPLFCRLLSLTLSDDDEVFTTNINYLGRRGERWRGSFVITA
jgi:hypothetical protein